MSDIKLKPCPFCEGMPSIIIEPSNYDNDHYQGEIAKVVCENDGCESCPETWSDEAGYGYQANTGEAVERWNDQKSYARLVEENAQLKADKAELLKEQKRLQSMLYDALSCTGYFDAVSKGVYQIQPVRIYPQQEKGEINGN